MVKVTTAAVNHHDSPGVELSVEDTGVGVKPEDRERIFQRFHRAREAGTEGETGTGLGLCICQEIVHLHGELWKLGTRSQAEPYLGPDFPPLRPVTRTIQRRTPTRGFPLDLTLGAHTPVN